MDSNITTETSQTPAIQLGWDCGNNIFLLNDEKDVEEIDEYELVDNDYVIIDGNCIYKIELDKELDMENNFVEVAKTQDDTYEFITWFYDGGTDLGEMLQKGFDKTRKEVL